MNSMFILGGENILLIKKRQFHNFQSMEANMARKTRLLKKLLEQLTPHKATFFSIKVINFNFHLKFKLVSLRWWDYKYSNNLFLQVHYYCKGWYHCFPLNWIITCTVYLLHMVLVLTSLISMSAFFALKCIGNIC